MYQLVKSKPAILTKKVEGWNFWHVFGNSPELKWKKFEIIALWAKNYLKSLPGGYDKFFLDCGEKGNTALHIATQEGHNGLAEFLLTIYEGVLIGDGLPLPQVQEKVAAYINMKDLYGRTLMHNLNFELEESLDTAEFFIVKGANLELVDKLGNKPHDLLGAFFASLHIKGNPLSASTAFDYARGYVEHGANPDQKSRTGKTLISMAQKYAEGWTESHTSLLRQIYQVTIKENLAAEDSQNDHVIS
jgi:hypothetical protein